MKNKLLSKILIVLMVMVSFFGSIIGVNASGKPSSLPDSVTVKVVDDVNLIYNTSYPGTARYKIAAFVKKTNNGAYVYCIEADKDTIPSGTSMSFNGEVDDVGLAAIISNGFPYNNMGYDDSTAFAITQTAIWLYYRVQYGVKCEKLDNIVDKNGNRIDDYNGGSNANSASRLKINKVWDLYNKALAAKKAGTIKPVIKTSVSSQTLTLSNNKLSSELITVNLTNASSFDVSSNGTIVDENGNVKTTFKNGEKFRVIIDGDGNSTASVSVKITAKGTSDKVYSYKSSNSRLQEVAYGTLVPETITVNKDLTFNYGPTAQNIEFSKIDVTTNKELPGAHLEVRDASGKLIESWISSEKTHFIKLMPGKYTLTETIAPAGYKLSTETVTFEVKADGTTTKVVMNNQPINKVDVEFSKVDVTTNKELPGATLEVKDSTGKLIESWVSTEKTHFIKLLPGKYTLTEKIAPEGYVLSTEIVTFEVKEDGTTTKVVMKNSPVKKYETEFSKIDVATGKELPGATLEVRDSSGKLIESWVSTEKTHFIKLLPGKYTLTEKIAPEGYVLSTETINFEVKEDGTTTKVVMKNELKKFDIEFSKIDVTTGKELPGAHLEVRDSSNKLIDSWVSSNETHFIKLVPGEYTLTETIAPVGYVLSTETVKFEVKADGSVTKVVMKNAPVKEHFAKISKVDITDGKELEGAHLEVRDSNNNLIESWVSSTEAHYIKLEPGKYTLTETIAPEGYELSTEVIEFEITEDGDVVSVVMENKPYIEVPITSLNASQVMYIIGGVLLSLSIMMVYGYVKKETL